MQVFRAESSIIANSLQPIPLPMNGGGLKGIVIASLGVNQNSPTKISRSILPLSTAAWVLLLAVGVFVALRIARKVYASTTPKKALELELSKTQIIDYSKSYNQETLDTMRNAGYSINPTFTMRQAVKDIVAEINEAIKSNPSNVYLHVPSSPFDENGNFYAYARYCGVANPDSIFTEERGYSSSWLNLISNELAAKKYIESFTEVHFGVYSIIPNGKIELPGVS